MLDNMFRVKDNLSLPDTRFDNNHATDDLDKQRTQVDIVVAMDN
jgi:hypothetical protein